jgi:hypothetical protein
MNYEFFHPGEVYYGLWKDDKRHGSGVQVDSYKTLLEGSWVNDKKEGVFFKRNYLEEIRMTYFKNDVEDEKSKNIYLNKKVILLENFKKKSNLFDILKGGKKSRKSKKIRKNKKSRKSKKYIIKK